jgi:LuxR family maltose regulon positive regulatory protein
VFIETKRELKWQGNVYQPTENLLTTKLERPFVDTRIVRRDSLTSLLKASSEQRVTLVIAPPGYGKTTLLVEWLSTSNSSNHHAVWVTCDQFDNLPLRFWAYIISGLKKACPEFHFNPQQLLQQEQEPDDLTLLNPLLNEIVAVPHHVILVLDDYHTITNADIQHQLSYFIEHLPHNLSLVLSSRVTPPIALSRLRAQHRLFEITERDLSFSLSEAQSFLINVMNLDIDQEQIVALWNSTEGWIAGLQLAALSHYRSRTRLPSPDVLHDNRLILDYFTEEVLNQQSAHVREFLLKTSVLEELSTPLCDAVLECQDSGKLLIEIEGANLFMVCLDNSCGYRYHPLFAQVLQTRLKQVYPQEVARLHLQACDWFLADKQLDKAISHALAAGALEKAAAIVETCATEAILQNDLIRILHWMFLLKKDGDMLIRHPRLAVYDALTNYHLQRLDQVKAILCEIEQILEAKKQPLNETDRLVQWQVAAIRAVLECSQGNPKKGISELVALLTTQPSEDHYFLGFITHSLALTYKDIGDLEAAANTFYTAYHHTLNYSPSAIQSLCASAAIRKQQARLREAQQKYCEAYELTKDLQNEYSIIALVLIGLLNIAFEQNHMEQAHYWAAEVLANRRQLVANPSAWMWMGLTSIDFGLVRYYLSLGDIEAAAQHFKDLKKHVPANLLANPDMHQHLVEVQALLGLAMEQMRIEDNLLPEIKTYLESKKELTPLERLTWARINRAHKQFSQARMVLDELEAHLRKTNEQEILINTLILKALVCQDLCHDERALGSISDALLLAEPNGYVRVFINEGNAVKHLLNQYLLTFKDGRLQHYVERLIAVFNAKSDPITDNESQALPKTTRLAENPPDLSQRELEVLQMLTTPLSYKEIASALTISVNTVRIHVKKVFHKLDAHSRKAALLRAKELKFLDDGA